MIFLLCEDFSIVFDMFHYEGDEGVGWEGGKGRNGFGAGEGGEGGVVDAEDLV